MQENFNKEKEQFDKTQYNKSMSEVTKPIVVIDAICGKGKTQYALQRIKETKEKFIYVTPYIKEIQRIKDWCEEFGVKVHEPWVMTDIIEEQIKRDDFCLDMDDKLITKSDTLKKLLSWNCNIVMTHALLQYIDMETIDLIKSQEYTLYLDEVHQVIEEYHLSPRDLKYLRELNAIKIVENNQVIWVDKGYEDPEGVFARFKALCELGAMYLYSDKLYIWCFPTGLFNVVKQTFVLTYLFEGQLQAFYYKLHNVPYLYRDVCYNKEKCKYELKEFNKDTIIKDIEFYEKLIEVYEGNMNFADNGITLTTYWYNKAYQSDVKGESNYMQLLQRNITNYFSHIVKAKSKDIIWTTKKKYRKFITGKGYTRSFLPLNARAINTLGTRHYLAYVYNRYLSPVEENFFLNRDVKVDTELFGLSELIQWIFRSAIRNKEKVYLYLPSYRMRNLLGKWKYLAIKHLSEVQEETKAEFIYNNIKFGEYR